MQTRLWIHFAQYQQVLSLEKLLLLDERVSEVVCQAHNYERYSVVTMLPRIFKCQTLINYSLSDLPELETLCSQFKHALHNILLRVTIIKPVAWENKQVILDWQRPSLSLRFSNNEVFKFEVSKSSAYAELSLNTIIKNYSIAVLNPHLLIWPVWSVLFIQFSPAAIFTY